MDTTTTAPEVSNKFIKDLLIIMTKHDFCEELYWDKKLEFFILCNDIFFWGSADAEEIFQEDLELLEQSLIDDPYTGNLLYCARKRQLRPQNAAYPMVLKEYWHFYDTCGPEREIDMLNPQSRVT